MKQKDFNKYNDKELSEIRNKLITHSFNDLPNDVRDFIYKQNSLIGSEHTRAMRCVSLIDHEIIDRFLEQNKNEII